MSTPLDAVLLAAFDAVSADPDLTVDQALAALQVAQLERIADALEAAREDVR
jgi:hypothetical protein